MQAGWVAVEAGEASVVRGESWTLLVELVPLVLSPQQQAVPPPWLLSADSQRRRRPQQRDRMGQYGGVGGGYAFLQDG